MRKRGRVVMRIVLFDGTCNLCNGTVDWILRHDRVGKFRFEPLQSVVGQEMVAKACPGIQAGESIVLIDDDVCYTKSTAVLRIALHLGGPWRYIARLLLLVPPLVRDTVYGVIAANRHRWFGKGTTCRILGDGERQRFWEG